MLLWPIWWMSLGALGASVLIRFVFALCVLRLRWRCFVSTKSRCCPDTLRPCHQKSKPRLCLGRWSDTARRACCLTSRANCSMSASSFRLRCLDFSLDTLRTLPLLSREKEKRKLGAEKGGLEAFLMLTRSSSREVRIRVSFSQDVYFSVF